MNDIEFLYGELINFECIEREAYEDAYNVLCTLDYAITETKDEKEKLRLMVRRDLCRNKVSRLIGALDMVNSILDSIAMYNDRLNKCRDYDWERLDKVCMIDFPENFSDDLE